MLQLDLNAIGEAVELIKKGVIDNPTTVIGFSYESNLFNGFAVELYAQMRGHSFRMRITKSTSNIIKPTELAEAFLSQYRSATGVKPYLGRLL
jgi:hypothetical protein